MAPKDSGGPPGGGPDANAKAANNGNANAGPLLFDAIRDPYAEERKALAKAKADRCAYLSALGLAQPSGASIEEITGLFTFEEMYQRAGAPS